VNTEAAVNTEAGGLVIKASSADGEVFGNIRKWESSATEEQ
jgi:hypothetical protein